MNLPFSPQTYGVSVLQGEHLPLGCPLVHIPLPKNRRQGELAGGVSSSPCTHGMTFFLGRILGPHTAEQRPPSPGSHNQGCITGSRDRARSPGERRELEGKQVLRGGTSEEDVGGWEGGPEALLVGPTHHHLPWCQEKQAPKSWPWLCSEAPTKAPWHLCMPSLKPPAGSP